MSKKYTTIPLSVVGEDEPRLALMFDALNVEVEPSPNWITPTDIRRAIPRSMFLRRDGRTIPLPVQY